MTRDEWKAIEEKYEQEVKAIVIPEWPTESQVKNISAQIDKTYTKAVFDYGRAKTADDDVDRMVDTVTTSNRTGLNETERKKNGVDAAKRYIMTDGRIVNLYELQEETNRRLVFMDSVLRALESKLRTLTLSYGALKIESNLGR